MITSDPRREPGGSCVSEPVATRREVDQLRADINRIDDHGTRGVGALQAQMTGVAADLAGVEAGPAAPRGPGGRAVRSAAAGQRAPRGPGAAGGRRRCGAGGASRREVMRLGCDP